VPPGPPFFPAFLQALALIVSPRLGLRQSWNPNGLANLENAIAKVKTHWIEGAFISLKSY